MIGEDLRGLGDDLRSYPLNAFAKCGCARLGVLKGKETGAFFFFKYGSHEDLVRISRRFHEDTTRNDEFSRVKTMTCRQKADHLEGNTRMLFRPSKVLALPFEGRLFWDCAFVTLFRR